MKLKNILREGEYFSISDVSDITVKKLTATANEADSDSLFFLLPGVFHNSQKTIPFLLTKKPSAIVCEQFPEDIKTDIPIIFCENARRLFAFAAARFYHVTLDCIKFIGITGTNGKTTTATMISRALTASGRKCGFIGTGKIEIDGEIISEEMYSMTTPDPPLLFSSIKRMEEAGCEFVIMEVSSHALALDKVAPIRFDTAVFTNLTGDHLDFHKNTVNYRNSKLKLFNQARLGIFNADDSYTEGLIRDSSCSVIRVGAVWNSEIKARNIKDMGLLGTEYLYTGPNLSFIVKSKLIGLHNVYNSLLALTASIAVGVKPCIAKRAISEIESIEGRGEVIRDKITVIIDYAHTKDAFNCILKTAALSRNVGSRLITVFGCGGEREKEKRPEMARLAEQLSDFVIVTTDNSRNESPAKIIKDIVSAMTKTAKRKIISDRRSAICAAINMAYDNDIVLIVGKGHEKYNIDKNGYHPFDERKIITEALNQRNKGHNNENEDNA